MFRRKKKADDEKEYVPERPMQVRRMFAYVRPYVKRLLIAFVATLIGAVLSLVFPEIIQRVVDSVLEERDEELLNQVTVFLVVIFLLRALSSAVEVYFLGWVGEHVVVDVRTDLYNHLQRMSVHFFSENRVGELASRASSDVTTMRSALVNNVNTFIQQTFIMIGAVGVMFLLNWRLTMFIIALIPVLILFGFLFGYYIRQYSSDRQDAMADALIITEETFQNIRDVKSFTREEYEIERHDSAIWRSFEATLRLIKVRMVFGPLVAFLGFASLAAILWFGGREVLDGRLSGGELIQFLFYGVTVAASFAALVNLYTQLQEAIGATKRVFELLDTKPDIIDKPDAIPLDSVAGRVTFEDVSFSYDGQQAVLRDIELDIASGEIVALVGPSGAGKTTMFNLIPRFYDPNSGRVLIDDHDLRDVKIASLRAQIGIVPQETLLFGGTIMENIRYGRLEATDEEVYEAARAANAHTFITELTDGYETTVGERGIKLSGGQRQRVSIARAILKNPRILLLDEATSSLDNESEHLVQEALGHLMQNRTTVIIAHRLSTIRVADRIAVLNKGAIVELGTHQELMVQDGLYAKLYEMQFRAQEEEMLRAGTD
jgi:ATP-binding cassette, subfamily B, bacterial MsbA